MKIKLHADLPKNYYMCIGKRGQYQCYYKCFLLKEFYNPNSAVSFIFKHAKGNE